MERILLRIQLKIVMFNVPMNLLIQKKKISFRNMDKIKNQEVVALIVS